MRFYMFLFFGFCLWIFLLALPELDLIRHGHQNITQVDDQHGYDRDCHGRVVDALVAGQSTMPFTYRIEGNPLGGLWGAQGKFVPSNLIQLTLEGGDHHGGGTEYIVVGDVGWSRNHGDSWSPLEELRSQPAGRVMLWDQLPRLYDPSFMRIGDCSEVDSALESGVQSYTYSLVANLDRVRRYVVDWRVDVDRENGLPARFEQYGHDGNVITVETRTYSSDVVIEVPTH